MLGTVIHPKNRILPLLRGHFCSRLPDEDFMIFDATHGIAMLRRDRKVQYMVMEHYDKNTGQEELDWQKLWKRFFDAVTIEQRRNERCQMTTLPSAIGKICAKWRCWAGEPLVRRSKMRKQPDKNSSFTPVQT